RRLLEGLEESVLRVLVEALRSLDDGDPSAALGRKERQLRRQAARGADADLAAGALGLEMVDVWMDPARHLSAGQTGSTRARERILREAEQAGRKILRERRLADVRRARQQHRVGWRLGRDPPSDSAPGRVVAAREQSGALDAVCVAHPAQAVASGPVPAIRPPASSWPAWAAWAPPRPWHPGLPRGPSPRVTVRERAGPRSTRPCPVPRLGHP